MTSPMIKMTADQELAVALSEFYDDPLGHVMFSYPWDTDKSIQLVELQSPWKERFNCKFGPDKWACEFLDELGEEVKANGFDGVHGVNPVRRATASGHGIGKSVLVAWIIKWIMDTRPLAKGTVTANTDTQLRTKTWAELGKWHRLSTTFNWFDFSAARGSMSLKHKELPGEWFVTAQTSREENSESFAGQHAANSTSFYIFDEASGIPNKIYEVREGGLSDGEPMVFDFGNPTRNSGQFYENCVGRFRHRYKVRMIDSRSVSITNKAKIEQDILDRGIDSDFVKVRVLGQFPSASSTQFIPMDIVEAAMGKTPPAENNEALVIGVDVARFGSNDTVLYPRIGRDARSFTPERYNGLNTVQVASKVADMVKRFRLLGKEVAAIFVDGGGIGGGVVDILRDAGYPVHDILFGGKPIDGKTYRFRSDEMWGRMKKWIEESGCLPSVAEPSGKDLQTQLTQREFGYTLSGNKIWLETKEDMQERGVDSPDVADGLCLTFASEMAPTKQLPFGQQRSATVISEYDPMEAKD